MIPPRILVATALLAWAVPVAAGATLIPGAAMPPIEGKTLDKGDPVTLPRDAQGHAAILFVGFSKASAKTTRPWIEACHTESSARSAEPSVICWDVRMLESVPRFIRGTVEKAMRKGLPPEFQRRALLVYTDNAAWRERLGVTDDDSAYIVAIDRGGLVATMATGPFAPDKMKKMFQTLGPEKPASPGK